MTLEDVIGSIALGGVILVALVFAYVIAQAGNRPRDDAAATRSARVVRLTRASLFAVLLAGFIAGSWATLRSFPIPLQHEPLGAAQVVEVVGRMWSWEITPDTVPVGVPVEFRVTSVDVNHGFGVYAPDGHMVTQTQAMPKYTNHILYTFTEPGTYTVHCLEYCGVGHAPMKGSFDVLAPKEK